MTTPVPPLMDLILLTGATGFLGFHLLLHILKQGHHVRCPVRSASKAQQLQTHPLIQALNPANRLTTIIVPDLTVDGAYDEACKNVTHIIHLANPFDSTLQPTDQAVLKTQIVDPIVKGALNILESAKKANTGTQTLKRILIASTAAAIVDLPSHYNLSESDRKEKTFLPTDRIAPSPEEYLMNPFHAYAVGKALALNRAEEWYTRENPSFDLAHTISTFVIGPNLLWKDKKDDDILNGSNEHVMKIVLGTPEEEKETSIPIPFGSVHISDVVSLTLSITLSASESIPRVSSFAFNATGEENTKWNDARTIVEEGFPEEVEKGVLPNGGSVGSIYANLDASGTEEVFGMRFKGYGEQIRDLVGGYLGLPDGDGGM